jgi:pyruvate/2-oxoglutarate dehydrogenase complex dihydrolipoamide dehydrogenase (E3) component/uncharacterized membrane protein YdjX (TVP38/TMEM64 family)
MTPLQLSKWLLLIVMGLGIVMFFLLDLDRYFSLHFLREQHTTLLAHVEQAPLTSALVFTGIYIATTALSLPGAAVLTLLAGALFGLGWGTVVVSFASTIGATLAFWSSRFLLRDRIEQRFGDRLRTLHEGMDRDGAYYLFTLRLVPIFPFVLVNLLMGLTSIPTRTYYWISQLGMLPGTLVYVNAGTQLAQIQSLQGILSPALIVSFALLGIFPWLARRFVDAVKTRRIYQAYPPPPQFDYNLIVIGAGAAGLVSAYIGSTLKAKVLLVEQHKMGGDCLNYGCVPSKTLIRSARLAGQLRKAAELGITQVHGVVDFRAVMDRVQQVISKIAPHDSSARYSKLGVDCAEGQAVLIDPWTVAVDGRKHTTRSIIIAAGSEPARPDLPGLRDTPHLTSTTLWQLRDLPPRLTIIGGGPIGCELAQAFAQLGTQVTLMQKHDRLLMREDPEVSALVQECLLRDGVRVLTACIPQTVQSAGKRQIVACRYEHNDLTITGEVLLIATGRKPRTTGYGLEALGIALRSDGTIAVNDTLQTRFTNIYAAGDVTGPMQFTHFAAHQAWYAAINALLGHLYAIRTDYSVVPVCTFTEPAVARVGHNELSAQRQKLAYEVTRYDLADLDRAITDGSTCGFVKVLTPPGSDRLLGVTIVGEQAGEMLAEFVVAMRHGLGLNKILGTLHAYPTFAEANKYSAGLWKKNHAPQRLLACLGRYHRWRRGGTPNTV